MQKDFPTQVIAELTEREREILRLIATGTGNKDIARQLFISSNTVKVHLRNIFAKIGVTSRTEAALYAIREGLSQAVDPPAVVSATQESPVSLLAPFDTKNKPYFLWLAALVTVLLVGVVILVVATYRTPASAPTVAVTSSAPAVALERWQEHAAMPTARSGLAVVAYENQIYAIAGETDQGVMGVVERYDPAADAWMELSPKPLPVADVSAVVISGRVYVPGGRTSSGAVTDVLEIYDPLQDAWELGAPLPVAVSGYALAAFEGRLYLFGGWDGQNYLNMVYIYRPESKSWSAGKSMPTARGFAGAAVAGGKIYVVGGENQDGILSTNEVYGLSLDSSNVLDWQTDEKLPAPASGIGVLSVVDSVYAVISRQDENGILVLRNNLGTKYKAWEFLPMPFEFGSRFSVVMLGTRLYIIGGQLTNRRLSLNVSYDAIYTIVLPVVK
jgi:DNA-binding CsgD family transcriptional regulator